MIGFFSQRIRPDEVEEAFRTIHAGAVLPRPVTSAWW
jgi:hypothetical protein